MFSSGAQDLDSIRLSTYRTACKLRFVQKKCNSECECSQRFVLHSLCSTLTFAPSPLCPRAPPSPQPQPPHPPVHLVDIWNVIEAFRENGINTMDLNADLSVARLEMVLSTIFYQLNKRMPTTHQISVEQSISLLLNFLLAAYDP